MTDGREEPRVLAMTEVLNSYRHEWIQLNRMPDERLLNSIFDCHARGRADVCRP
jgi:hypothetical protein